jgi:transcriptional regulator with PAS, ATPase and Fis domain
MVGSSPAILKLSRQIVRIARTPGMRVFITGETGTGKEVVARQIHELSGCDGPFRAINCAATVEGLLESELFGHEKGAFTGAHTAKRGYWEDAANGTLFLDEIAETSLAVQAKLLRALQEGLIRRVGSNQEIKVTPRVIAASNKDVEAAIKEGSFRQDLYYRLGQVLRLPPLRDRREDIPQLVEYFWRRSSTIKVVTPEAVDALCEYDWPGNVRELESVVQQLIAFAGRFVFREDVLRCIQKEESAEEIADKFLLALWQVSKQYEQSKWPTVAEIRNLYVQKAFSLLGKESAVAKRLGIDVRTVSAILEAERNKLIAGSN